MDSVAPYLMSDVPCPHQKAARIPARPITFRETVSPTPTCIRPVNRQRCLAIILADRPSLSDWRVSDYIEGREFCAAMFEAGHAEGLNSNCFATGVDRAEDIMNLKDAFLCIDCDEVFAIDGSPSNPRCPRCASSVLMPVSAWVRTWTAFERGAGDTGSAPPRKRSMELVYSMPFAA